MGFSDSLKKLSGSIVSSKTFKTGDISRAAGIGRGAGKSGQNLFDISRGKNIGSALTNEGQAGLKSATIVGSLYSGAANVLATQDMLDKGSGARPPSVGEGPGVGAGNTEAQRESRRRAVAAAASRRKGSRTVTTTPLGVTEFAGTSKKRLLGE